MRLRYGIGLVLMIGVAHPLWAQLGSWPLFRGQPARLGWTNHSRQVGPGKMLLSWVYPPLADSNGNLLLQTPRTVNNFTPVKGRFEIRCGFGNRCQYFVPSLEDRVGDYYDDPDDDFRTSEPYVYAFGTKTGDLRHIVRFIWTSHTASETSPAGKYKIFAWIPSSGTLVNGIPVPNTITAVYTITDGMGNRKQVTINQMASGWVPLGEESYWGGPGQPITVELTNRLPDDSPDGEGQALVVADAIRFVPDLGSIYTSPVVVPNPDGSNTQLIYFGKTDGKMYCLEHNLSGTGTSVQERWSFTVGSETLSSQGSETLTVDNQDLLFQNDGFWLPSAGGVGGDHVSLPATNRLDQARHVVWNLDIPREGNYYVSVRFPASPKNTRHARYKIVHAEGETIVWLDQTRGGNWVPLGNRPFHFKQGRSGFIELNNWSPDPIDEGAEVVADGVQLQQEDQAPGAIFSTPHVANVRIDTQGTEKWVVIFGSNNGKLYCLDALSGTPYWVLSLPNAGAYTYSSPVIVNFPNDDLVIIGNSNGRVYAVNTAPKNRFDSNNNIDDEVEKHLQWVFPELARRELGSFVASPAYENGTLFIGSLDGRVYALDAFGDTGNSNEGDLTKRKTTLKWAYPFKHWEDNDPDDEPPLGAITTTPVVFGDRVCFASDNGRAYAVRKEATDTRRTTLIWQYPPDNESALTPFRYSSPAVVGSVPFENGRDLDLFYLGSSDGYLYALDVNTTNNNQRLVWKSENVGGGIYSSPSFLKAVDPGSRVVEAVTFGTNIGELQALYANDLETTLPSGDKLKAFQGWKLFGTQVFSSPAVANGFLIVGDTGGLLYAFNDSGGALIPEEWEDQIVEINPEEQNPNYSNTKVSVTTDKAIYEEVLRGDRDPDQVPSTSERAFEWGDRLYVILYDFPAPSGGENPQFDVQFTGQGTTQTVKATVRPWPRDSTKGFAYATLTIQGFGPSFCPPGPGYLVQMRRPLRRGAQGPLETVKIDGQPFEFGVANPLGLRGGLGQIGMDTNPANNLQNGNGRTFVYLFQNGSAPIPHGQTGFGPFEVADRSKSFFGLGRSIELRAISTDLAWLGGSAAVINPLPWDILPFGIPNVSPDYPDISSRFLSALYRGAADLFRTSVRLSKPGGSGNARTLTPDPVQVSIEVPRFQPANQTGYQALLRTYVDSNNNGLLDGLGTLAITPPPTKIEAYRELTAKIVVPPDYRLAVEEQTIDFGKLPASFGFDATHPNYDRSPFAPYDAAGRETIFTPFWKPFTVKNLGNVNLYRLYMTKEFQVGSRDFSFYLLSDTNSPMIGIPAKFTLASTLDDRFFPVRSRFWPGGAQPYTTLHKARPGDYAPTYLSIPDLPYGQIPDPNQDRIRKPMVGLGIPPFQPAGTYSQWIYVYMLPPGSGRGGVIPYDPNTNTFGLPVSNPTMRVVVTVRETRLTGGTNTGVLTQIDPPPGDPPPASAPTNMVPAAFRLNDPNGARLYLVWSSNRPDSPAFYLYSSLLNWDPNRQDSYGWNLTTANSWWQSPPWGAYPNDPNGDLFDGLTAEERRTIRHTNPCFYTDVQDGSPWLFWTGSARKQGRTIYRTFYAPFDPRTGQPGTPRRLELDPFVARTRPVVVGIPNLPPSYLANTWVFYTASTSGKSEIYYVPLKGRVEEGNWQREFKLMLSPAIKTVNEVAVVPRLLVRSSIEPPIPFLDVVMSATTSDRNIGEIFYARYRVNPRRPALEGPVAFSRVNDEILQKEKGENLWRARHLDWVPQRRQWGPDDILIKINGTRVNTDPNDPVVDEQSGLLTYRYLVGGEERGVIVVDPRNGTLRFPDFAPRLNDVVSVSYTPRLMRLSDLGIAGDHSQVVAFLQKVENPRHNRADPSRSLVRKQGNQPLEPNEKMPVDRFWNFYRRAGSAPGNPPTFYYKTLRMGVQLRKPIAVMPDGSLPLNGNNVGYGQAHVAIFSDSQLGYYEIDWARGRIYFTQQDEGKMIRVRYIPNDDITAVVEETGLIIRWIEEGTISGNRPGPQFETPVPMDLPTDELYLWAMPNVEFGRTTYESLYGGLDEGIFLFWTTPRSGVPDLYTEMLQPRFYIDNPERDAD